MKAEKIILGNVITMDAFKPYAEAIAVADEKIIYVGSKLPGNHRGRRGSI